MRHRIYVLLFILVFLSAPTFLANFVKRDQQTFALSQPLTIVWQHQSAAEQTTTHTPAAYNARIYLPLARGAVVSLSSADGTTAWRAETGGEISASPAADQRGVYVASQTFFQPDDAELPRATGALRLLSTTTGVTLWARTLLRPLRGSLAGNETTLYGGTEDGQVYAFDKKTGDILWTFKHTAGFASTPLLHLKQLYIGSTDGTMFSLQQTTGKPLWRYRTRGALRGVVSVAEDLIFFGSVDGYVYALEAAKGKLRWRTRTGAGVQSVALTEGGLVAASFDNFVYSFTPQRGKQQWKRLLAGRIIAQPLATKDGVLFAPLSGDACVVLNPRDGRQLNTLPVGADNNTGASPILAGNVLIITTRTGVLAFSSPSNKSETTSRTQ